MPQERIGYRRLYNARFCTLVGRDQLKLEFNLGTVSVTATLGPGFKYPVMSGAMGEPVPKDSPIDADARRTDGPHAVSFPAQGKLGGKFFVEIMASRLVEVTSDVSARFHAKDPDARTTLLRLAEHHRAELLEANLFVAGFVGLRFHKLFVADLVCEDLFAFRDSTVAFSHSFTFHTVEAVKWSREDDDALRANVRAFQRLGQWSRAASVLSWLLRAWGDADPINRFIALFIPLEMVLQGIQPSASEKLLSDELLALITEYAPEDRREPLLSYAGKLGPPLTARFTALASEAGFPGRDADVEAFRKFNRIRTKLMHRGEAPTDTTVTVAEEEVRTFEDLVERYINYQLFGDDRVYRSAARPRSE